MVEEGISIHCGVECTVALLVFRLLIRSMQYCILELLLGGIVLSHPVMDPERYMHEVLVSL